MSAIKYTVRSRALVDIYNELRTGRLVLSPHFQRKLVWRLAHKVDFIETILLGYPFPEVFVARGDINLDQMTAVSAVVDGQQRLNSIKTFIEGAFEVRGSTYAELPAGDREAFLKYEIAVIDLDVSIHDAKVREVFTRLNRTFYALSNIEKMATEYASSEFMLFAKLLAGEFREDGATQNISADTHNDNQNITDDFIRRANSIHVSHFHRLILESGVFSPYEISRQVHLMFVLNIISTCIIGSYYNRNDEAKTLLDKYADGFPDAETILARLDSTAKTILKTKMNSDDFWTTKSNMFTLIVEGYKINTVLDRDDIAALRRKLLEFVQNVTSDYRLAAKEGVNNSKERELRGRQLREVISTFVS